MKSPFPGMDPYLEGPLWPDVHHALASEIRKRLVPHLASRYVARIAKSVFVDREPGTEYGVMYPDVEVLHADAASRSVRERGAGAVTAEAARAGAAWPPPVTPLVIPLPMPIEVRLPRVEVREVEGNRLVTAIEILSPVNKRGEGLDLYRRKRERLARACIHLLEIDLIRRGTRPLAPAGLPDADYMVTLTRAGRASAEVWPIGLTNSLPTVPVPLIEPDPDVPLDLQAALEAIYAEAAYGVSIDYAAPPPPPPLAADAAALRTAVTSPGGAE